MAIISLVLTHAERRAFGRLPGRVGTRSATEIPRLGSAKLVGQACDAEGRGATTRAVLGIGIAGTVGEYKVAIWIVALAPFRGHTRARREEN
jgi:hypothetical protein